MTERAEIKLLADLTSGGPAYETVPVTVISEGRFVLLASPGFAPGFAKGDEVEPAPDNKLGYRIVRRGGNVCVQVFLDPCSAEVGERLANEVKLDGGELDGGIDSPKGHLLIFNFPIATGFNRIEAVLDRISKQYPVASWMYGNVYSPDDGVTPLNWW